MKLLFLLGVFRQNWGGGPESIRLMARKLAPFGVSCDVFEGERLHREIETLDLLPQESAETARARLETVSKYDAVLQVGPWQNFLHTRKVLSAMRHDQPFLYLPRGGLARIELSRLRDWKKYPYLVLLENRIVDRADAMVFSSQCERVSLSRLVTPDFASHVIPDYFDWHSAEEPEEVSAHDTLEVGFLAETSRRKGLLPLIEACLIWTARDDGPRVRLTVGGTPRPGSEAYMAEARRLAATAGSRLSIDFIGRVSHEARERFYRKLDLFVVPSLFESYGLTVLEALATGCTVVCAPQIGVLENLSGLQTLTVAASTDPADIANALAAGFKAPRASRAEKQRTAQAAIAAINATADRGWQELLGLASRT